MLTWNNPPHPWEDSLQSFDADYAIGQLEKGKDGTEHIQASLFFEEARDGSSFRSFPVWIKGISLKDFGKVCNYSRKNETRISGPIEFGNRPQNGKRRDFELALKLAREGREEEISADIYIPYYSTIKKISLQSALPPDFGAPRGTWIYGQPGVGKSRFVRNENPKLFLKSQSKWWDGYRDQPVVLLDDFDEDGLYLAHNLKIWADAYACYGEIKGGSVALKYHSFIVTSNSSIGSLYGSKPILCRAISRRFAEFEMDSTGLLIEKTGQWEIKVKYFESVMNL